MSTTEKDRLQALADQHLADARRTQELNDLVDEALDGLIPDDEEILSLIMATYDLPRDLAIQRMACFNLDWLRAAS